MDLAKADKSFAMHRCRAASISCARLWGSMRSPLSRPPQSIKPLVSSNLTTVLAHSSGEWIASDWPVCEIADMATPQRMGAALTYARRYALFTLVGIAGEDDLDAPDLERPTSRTSGIEKRSGNEHGRLNSWRRHNLAPRTIRRDAKVRSKSDSPALGPETSAELRDSLVAEISHLGCADDAATWAQRSLPEKNRLTASDAQRVDGAFTAKLASFVASAADPSNTPEQTDQPSTPHPRDPNGLEKRSRSNLIDKGALALPEPRRIRDRDHVRYVAKQPCLICARQPSDAHHLRFAQNRALGRKVSDEFTVPMCRGHHREVHRSGDEVAWWRRAEIDPSVAARALWLDTHPLSA